MEVESMSLKDTLLKIFNRYEEPEEAVEESTQTQQGSLEIDEEDKLVVALAASIMAGKDKPDSHYHISSITRIQ
jgi:hypothetical protein